MKILGFLILFAVPSVFAANPLIRICNLTGGVFHEVKTFNDQIGFCQYGSAMIDALSVLDITSNNHTSEAVQAFHTLTPYSCEEAGADGLNAEDFEGNRFLICQFGDHSAVEITTLQGGPSAPSNTRLVQALKMRF